MTEEDHVDEIEPYSPESRARLQDRAAALATALEQHTRALVDMTGGIDALATLFQLNDDIRQLAAAWDDAVFDHTGTFPIALESVDEEDDDGADQDADDGPDSADGPFSVSVMSRWDLDIIDPAALIRAGQAAHQRANPSDTDAASDIGEVGEALYAIVHEHGEPWFEMPGVGTVAGHRTYLRRDSDETPLGELGQDVDEPPVAPTGSVLFSESW